MGKNHVRVLNKLSNLVGISDIDTEQGKKIAKTYGISYYEDYLELFLEVDAIVIAVPTQFHMEIALSAIERGIHVLVEKPLADSVENATKIVKYADKHNVTLAVGHIERHNPVVSHAKDKILQSSWGEVLTLSSRRVSSYPERIRDVGVVYDLAVHDLDILSFLSGSRIESVFSLGGHHKNAIFEDHCSILINFENSLIGQCEVNWLTPMKVRSLNIVTETCFVNLDYINQEVETFKSEYIDIQEGNLYSSELSIQSHKAQIEKGEPLVFELIDFLESTLRRREPLVSGRDGLNAVLSAEAVLESIESKKVVTLDYSKFK